jgi:hypothetical protein
MLMELDRIEGLLDKYWAGETSLEEEKTLRHYFATEQVPEHLEPVAALFKLYAEEGARTLTEVSFEAKVMEKIPGNGAGKIRPLLMQSMKIAAGLALVITAGYLIWKEPAPQAADTPVVATAEDDTFEDPIQAFEETKKALLLLSSNIGRGKKPVEKIGTLHEAEEKIKRNESAL